MYPGGVRVGLGRCQCSFRKRLLSYVLYFHTILVRLCRGRGSKSQPFQFTRTVEQRGIIRFLVVVQVLGRRKV